MKESRAFETMTLLQNGQALVTGGETFDKSSGKLVPYRQRRTLQAVVG